MDNGLLYRLLLMLLTLNCVTKAKLTYFSESCTITGITNHGQICFIETSDGVTSKTLKRSFCTFAKKLTYKPISMIFERFENENNNPEIISMKLANKRTKWYNEKRNSIKEFTMNGVIDDIELLDDNACYISIVDKSDETNSYKYQRAYNNEICEYSQDLFLKNVRVTATIRLDSLPNFANDLVNILPINEKVEEIFRINSQYFNKTNYGRNANLRKYKRDLEGDTIHMSTLLAQYYELRSVHQINRHSTKNDPIYELGTVKVNVMIRKPSNRRLIISLDVPLYVRAKIYSNQRVHERTGWSQAVIKQMDNMGELKCDDYGHLIARSLGGSQEVLNIVPMAKNVNRHVSLGGDNTIQNNPHVNPDNIGFRPNMRDMGFPLSTWRSNEEYIEKFLKANTNGYADYTVVIQYKDLISRVEAGELFEPEDLRPTHFMQEMRLYDASGNHVNRNSDHTWTVINHPLFQCTTVEP